MKRTMKKAIALCVTAMMVLAMSVSVFAETGINGHTFVAYQIFTGTQATDGGALGNIDWGNGVNGSAILTALKADTTLGSDFADCTTAAEVAVKVATYSDDSANAKAFARIVDANKTSTTTAISADNKISTPGYYLIVDNTATITTGDARNLSLLAVSNSVTIDSKTSVPTLVKKVKDTNDSKGETSGWQDSADYDIGDSIPYQLTATMGDLTNFPTYYVSFEDTMTHLTYVDGSVKVTVGGANNDKTTDFTTSWDATNKKLTVTCNNVKALGATTGTEIVVTYNATLDADATIGSTGNPNVADLEYSNNPNNSGNGTSKPADTGKTPEDKNIVFTYKVDANKIKTDRTALAGAAFELFKQDSAGNWNSVSIQNATKGNDGTYTLTSNTVTSFEWKGIDDGTYKIVEVITPAGYNTIADQTFTVSATHTDGDAPALTALTGTAATGSVIAFTPDVSAGSLTTDIENKAGSILPSTGGMGTKLFYLFGAILVLGAGVLLIARRRMAK